MAKLNAGMGSNECAMAFPTRVIALTADPSSPDDVYAALEVAGVIRSTDGGVTWANYLEMAGMHSPLLIVEPGQVLTANHILQFTGIGMKKPGKVIFRIVWDGETKQQVYLRVMQKK